MNGTHTSAAINQLMRAAHATSMSRCRSACGSHHRGLVARTSQPPVGDLTERDLDVVGVGETGQATPNSAPGP